jgi:hypothetical protein
MGKGGQAGAGVSSDEVWDRLEELVREQAQAFVQKILEEEVTEFPGRRKSERRAEVDGVVGYRNGYGMPRCLAASSGTITLGGLGSGDWRSGSRAGYSRCLRGGRRRSGPCSRPEQHWRHLGTTHVVESPFASVRLRTTAKRFKRVDSAATLIWKLLTVAEKHFRKLNAPICSSRSPRATSSRPGVLVSCRRGDGDPNGVMSAGDMSAGEWR